MKFEKWLRENGFEIIDGYNKITSTMRFKKDNLVFKFRPYWYNGNKVGAYTVLHNKDNPNAILVTGRDNIISASSTQKEVIKEFYEYCKNNNII